MSTVYMHSACDSPPSLALACEKRPEGHGTTLKKTRETREAQAVKSGPALYARI